MAPSGSPTGQGTCGQGGPWGQVLGLWVSHGGSGVARSHPCGLAEPLAAACGVGELLLPAQLRCPSLPSTIYNQAVRLLPQPR